MTTLKSIPYRIRIGITGHRKKEQLPPIEVLIEKIKEVLGINVDGTIAIDSVNTIFKFYPESSLKQLRNCQNTPIAYSIISPLAEGSDRIAARAVLQSNDARLQVVLPFNKEYYVQDFQGEDSVMEFEEMLALDPCPVKLSDFHIESNLSAEEIKSIRHAAFRDIGYYVVDQCDVLIVIWDGKGGKPGGTKEILEYSKQVKCPRVVISVPDQRITNVDFIAENGLNADSIVKLDQFNQEKELTAGEKLKAKSTEDNIFTKYIEANHIDKGLVAALREDLLPYYAKSSLTSARNRDIYKNAGIWAYRLATLAVFTVGLGLVVKPFYHYSFLLEFLLLVLIFLLVFRANRKHAHQKWIEHRFLVERLRICNFFFATGLDMKKLRMHPYLGISDQEDWIARVWNELWDRVTKRKGTSSNKRFAPEDVTWIQKALIQDQMNWHKIKKLDMKKSNYKYEIGGLMVYTVAIIAASLHGFPHFLAHYEYSPIADGILTIVALGLPATGAMMEGIRHIMEYSRNHKRYHKMHIALENLNNKFSTIKDQKRLQDLMNEADDLMMQEVIDWLSMRRVLELEPVA